MSIKQGDYLKQLRTERGMSQEKLAEAIGISRQSISKWEQGLSSPDIENIKKLSEFFGVSADALVHGEADEIRHTVSVSSSAFSEKTDNTEAKKPEKKKKKRSWLFPAFPILMVILYCILGILFPPQGWYIGWLVLLLIPLFYTGIFAVEKKKPIVFCYPVLVLIVFMLCGLCLGKWHPAWILFLTIPLFYIITAKKHK